MNLINNQTENAQFPLSFTQNLNNNSQLSASRRESEFNPYSEYSSDCYMFREEDIKSIIDDYNTQIRELLEDNQILKEKNNFLKDKSKSTEIQKYYAINQKLDSHQSKLRQSVENLEDCQNKINRAIEKETEIQTKISQENLKDLEEPNQISTYEENLKNLKDSKTKKIKLLQDISKLIEENTNLQQSVIKEFCEKRKIRVCGRCKQKYYPLENNETSCQYHPGRLKYYSCLGCGGDEYHSCCMKCSNCSKGCKFDRHVTQG